MLDQLEISGVAICMILGFAFFAAGVAVQWAWEEQPYSSLFEWLCRGGRQFGTAGVVVPFLCALIILLISGQLAYIFLATDPKAKWEYLSFAAPSTSVLAAAVAFGSVDDEGNEGRNEPWYAHRLFEQAGFPALFLSLLGIPFGYMGYLASHDVPGLDLWVWKTVVVLTWLPIPANMLIDEKRNLRSDQLIVAGWAVIGAGLVYLLLTLHY